MRFWKRPKTEFDVAREAFSIAVEPGHLACSTEACDRHDASACSYQDRRGHSCHIAGCPLHGERLDGHVFCTLHADTVRAVGAVEGKVRPGAHQMSSLPEVDNPGPSLVSWVARDLHDRVVELLERNLRDADQEHLLIDEVVTPVRGIDGTRRWEQAWKVVSPTGLSLKVAVLVDEADPSEVVIRVGTEQVARGVPPWFTPAGRRAGRLSNEAAAIQRHDYYEPIHQGIEAAVLAERSAGVRGPY